MRVLEIQADVNNIKTLSTCDTFPDPVNTKVRGPKCFGSSPARIFSPSSYMDKRA